MSDAVAVSKADLERVASDLKKAVEVNERLEKNLKAMQSERDVARAAANQAKLEAERLRKALPSEKVQQENKGLREAIADAHRKINAIEKELAAAKAETETHRRAATQTLRRFEGMQATFDTLQIARDKAQADLGKALADVQKGAESYAKLKAEFDVLQKAATEKKKMADAKAMVGQIAAGA